MNRRAFLGLGLASIGAGAILSTGAFSATSAGRGVAVTAADDENEGLLEIRHADEADTDPVFENNTGVTMDLELTPADPTSDATIDPSALTLSAGEAGSVSIEASETAVDVDIVATLVDGGIATGEITLQRTFSVAQPVVGIDGELRSAGNSGKVSFAIHTTGDVSVTIEGFDIETKHDLEGVGFTDRKTEFDGDTLPVTFNQEIDVELNRFDEGVSLRSDEFVDPDSSAADIVVTLDLAEHGVTRLGIDAEPFHR